jgi:hypothetical protein
MGLMRKSDQIDMTLFSRYIRELGWPAAMADFGAGDLIVADIEFLNLLSRIASNTKCEAVTPQNIENVKFEHVKRVLVFCRENEHALVRRLRTRYPGKLIVSGTHEFMLVGIKKRPLFVRVWPKAARATSRTLVLASPGIEAEFLCKHFPALGLPVPLEYFSRSLGVWLEGCSNFSPLRYTVNAERKFLAKGQFSQLIHADILEKLFEKTNLTETRFVRFLTENNYRVVRLTDPRLLRQAMMNGILFNSSIRSPWTSPQLYNNTKFQWNNSLIALEGMKKIPQWSQMLDRVTAALPSCLEVDFMQLVSQPKPTVLKVADYLECSLADDDDIPPYVDPVAENKSVTASFGQMQRELIDRMGLHTDGSH